MATDITQLVNQLKELQPFTAILIGVPGSGKSTFIRELAKHMPIVIASTDDMIDALALKEGVNYGDAFKLINWKQANRDLANMIGEANMKKQNVVIDRTNMTKKGRATMMAHAEVGAEDTNFIAINFDVADDEVRRRLRKREQETGKHIPGMVMASMYKNYQAPTKAEGFVKIITLKG